MSSGPIRDTIEAHFTTSTPINHHYVKKHWQYAGAEPRVSRRISDNSANINSNCPPPPKFVAAETSDLFQIFLARDAHVVGNNTKHSFRETFEEAIRDASPHTNALQSALSSNLFIEAN